MATSKALPFVETFQFVEPKTALKAVVPNHILGSSKSVSGGMYLYSLFGVLYIGLSTGTIVYEQFAANFVVLMSCCLWWSVGQMLNEFHVLL